MVWTLYKHSSLLLFIDIISIQAASLSNTVSYMISAFTDVYHRSSDVDSTSDIVSPRSSRHINYDITRKSLSSQQPNLNGESGGDTESKCGGEGAKNEKTLNLRPRGVDPQWESDESDSDNEAGVLQNCGLLTNNCLPCLATDVSSDENKRPLSPSNSSAMKKMASIFSFKRKEEQATPALCKPHSLVFSGKSYFIFVYPASSLRLVTSLNEPSVVSIITVSPHIMKSLLILETSCAVPYHGNKI